MVARIQVNKGDAYNGLIVVREVDSVKTGNQVKRVVRVQCPCGKKFDTQLGTLRRGGVSSCGCSRIKHGMSETRLHDIWKGMRYRCNDKSNPVYGGKGIRVCKRWRKFKPFMRWALANGYSDDLSIDRVKNDGNYKPSNCRWATSTTQNRNMTTNVRISYKGHSLTIGAMVEKYGHKSLNADNVRNRLRSGWKIKQALKIPLHTFVGRKAKEDLNGKR